LKHSQLEIWILKKIELLYCFFLNNDQYFLNNFKIKYDEINLKKNINEEKEIIIKNNNEEEEIIIKNINKEENINEKIKKNKLIKIIYTTNKNIKIEIIEKNLFKINKEQNYLKFTKEIEKIKTKTDLNYIEICQIFEDLYDKNKISRDQNQNSILEILKEYLNNDKKIDSKNDKYFQSLFLKKKLEFEIFPKIENDNIPFETVYNKNDLLLDFNQKYLLFFEKLNYFKDIYKNNDFLNDFIIYFDENNLLDSILNVFDNIPFSNLLFINFIFKSKVFNENNIINDENNINNNENNKNNENFNENNIDENNIDKNNYKNNKNENNLNENEIDNKNLNFDNYKNNNDEIIIEKINIEENNNDEIIIEKINIEENIIIKNNKFEIKNEKIKSKLFYLDEKMNLNISNLNYNEKKLRNLGKFLCYCIINKINLDLPFSQIFMKFILSKSILFCDFEKSFQNLLNQFENIFDNDFNSFHVYFDKLNDHFIFEKNNEIKNFENFEKLKFIIKIINDGKEENINLLENGSKKLVTNENKIKFLQLYTKYKVLKSNKKQINAFLSGFFGLIPSTYWSLFSVNEFEILLNGYPNLDILDWKKNTLYKNFNSNDDLIVWFWEILLNDLNNFQRFQLLFYITNKKYVPDNGFFGFSPYITISQNFINNDILSFYEYYF
jgi:hypothetical protein